MVPGTGDPKCLLPDKFYYPGEEIEFMSNLDFLAVAMPLTKATEGSLQKNITSIAQGFFCLILHVDL